MLGAVAGWRTRGVRGSTAYLIAAGPVDGIGWSPKKLSFNRLSEPFLFLGTSKLIDFDLGTSNDPCETT